MRTPRGNERARAFAEKYRLPMTGGSDAHSHYEVGNAFTEVEASDLDEFRKGLLKGRTIVSGHLTFFPFLLVTKLAKIGIIGRPP